MRFLAPVSLPIFAQSFTHKGLRDNSKISPVIIRSRIFLANSLELLTQKKNAHIKKFSRVPIHGTQLSCGFPREIPGQIPVIRSRFSQILHF